VIIVDAYSPDIPGEKLITACKFFEQYLLGVVINKVPVSQAERVRAEASSSLGKTGIDILGVLPEDRSLFTLTVGEIAGHIQGEILNNAEKSAELVEDIMLGALCVDPGPMYFGRKANKVAVLRDERSDMQMAALETSTRALVISGNTAPIPSVLNRAQAKEVPIIVTGEDVVTIATSIEDALGTTRFNQENKLPRLAEIMEQNFNFGAVYQGLERKS
jgi:BioD-like phosphotransacetylase family protein